MVCTRCGRWEFELGAANGPPLQVCSRIFVLRSNPRAIGIAGPKGAIEAVWRHLRVTKTLLFAQFCHAITGELLRKRLQMAQ